MKTKKRPTVLKKLSAKPLPILRTFMITDYLPSWIDSIESLTEMLNKFLIPIVVIEVILNAIDNFLH